MNVFIASSQYQTNILECIAWKCFQNSTICLWSFKALIIEKKAVWKGINGIKMQTMNHNTNANLLEPPTAIIGLMLLVVVTEYEWLFQTDKSEWEVF